MIAAFGPRAEAYARGLGGLEAVIADPDRVAPAYLEAVRRREAGVERGVYGEAGFLRADITASDQELLMRLAQRYAFVWVQTVTTEIRDHVGSMGRNADLRADWRRIYDEFHPVAGRPQIERVRARLFEPVEKAAEDGAAYQRYRASFRSVPGL